MALNVGKLVGHARRYAASNPDKVSSGLDRVGDLVDRRTGGKHRAQITKAKDAAGKALGSRGGRGARPDDGRPADGRRDDGPAGGGPVPR